MFKTNNILVALLKAILFVLMIYILSIQLNRKSVSLADFNSMFSTLSLNNYIFGAVAFLLMPLNWCLESVKWKQLVHIVQKWFTISDAIKAVLIGVFFGFITPNRIGEFGGRLFKIESGNKANALNLSFIGGLAQFVITFLIGLTASIWLIVQHFDLNLIFAYLFLTLIYIVSLYIYFNFKRIVKFLLSYKIFIKFSEKYVFNFDLSQWFLLQILLITLLRYSVYVFQYVFVLSFLGINLEFVLLAKVISTMLLIQTIIPSFALIDVGIRGNVLLFLLAEYSDKQLVMLVGVLLVWILNLVIPAIIGYINFLNLNLEVKNEKFNNHITTINNRE